MWWIWIIVVVVVVAVGILIATLVVRSRKKTPPGLDEIERGFKRYQKHVEERTDELDDKLAESSKAIEELNERAARVASERNDDHEKIRAAGDDWGELDRLAKDIEERR